MTATVTQVLVGIGVWLFFGLVVLPAMGLTYIKYERWVRARRERRHTADVVKGPWRR